MNRSRPANWLLPALLSIFCLTDICAQTPVLDWAHRKRNNADDVSCLDIFADNAGHIFSGGAFGGNLDFDPGGATFTLSSVNQWDAYIQKLDTSENLVWAVAFNGTDNQEVRAVTTDDAGNVFGAGYFVGTTDFDPGAGTFNMTPFGIWDLFVVKLDPNGNFQWIKRTGAASEQVWPTGIVTDGANNVISVGRFTGIVDFNPNVGAVTLYSSGWYDAYIQKLDPNGVIVWAHGTGGSSAEIAEAIDVNTADELAVSGIFISTTVDFDPGPGTVNLSRVGNQDFYLQKFDSNGNLLWARSIGGTGASVNGDTKFDPVGNVISAGRFDNTVDFDPGPGAFNMTSAAGTDSWVQKLDGNGNFVWARQISSTGDVWISSVATDPSGNIYLAGDFDGTVDLDPGPGVDAHTTSDIHGFVMKLDASGNFVWSAIKEGNDETVPYDCDVDQNLNVYTGGDFHGSTDFDPQATVFSLNANGPNYAQFLQKLRQVGLPLPLENWAFSAYSLDDVALLEWTDEKYLQRQHYDILRSSDKRQFAPIAEVKPGAEATTTFADPHVLPGNTYWYQLQATDLNGAVHTSEIREVHMPDTPHSISVFPNPANTSTTLRATAPLQQVDIVDLTGKVIQTMQANGNQSLRIETGNLPTGLYWLRTSGGAALRLQVIH